MAGGVYLLDETRAVIGRLDPSYATLSTVRRFWGIDSFSLEIDRRRLYASEIALGRWIFLPASGELYAVELIDATREGSGRAMSVMGRSIEGAALAERRVLPPPGEAYDRVVGVSAETAVKHYVAANAGPSADAARQIPGLAIAADALRGPSITTQGRYQALADLLSQIGMIAGLGWTTTYDRVSDTINFDVVEGVDRSATVFLDFAFETLESWERLDDATDSKTLAIVAGQGEGAEREVVLRWSGSEPTGLARREAFVDARDVELGNTDLLEQRGDAFLAAAGPKRRIEAKMHQHGSFRYGRDFDLGDLVLVRSDGTSFVSRVVEATSKWSTSVETPEITLALDRPFPTLRATVTAGSSGAAGNPIVDTGPGAHPDLAAHDALGLATDAELADHATTPHGGGSPGSGTVSSAVGHSTAHGASSDYARTDHRHGRETFGAVQAETSFGLAAADGSATTVTRSDHRHGSPSLPATPTRTVYTTGSGNWSKPAGCRWVEVEVVGGGGGGGGAAATASGEKASGAGGAGGGYARKIFAASTLSATEPYAVGAAGSGATAGNNSGGAGSASYFGASGYRVQGNGGGGGGGGAAKGGVDTTGVLGGTGGTGSGGDINVTGDDGWTVRSAASGHVMPGNGGGSALGGQTQAPQGDSAGKTGKQYGGGGSGGYSQPSQSASAGGAGAAGAVIVTAFF